MKTSGNTILITGGGSGIGRGLAESFHRLGNHVIIAGRRLDVLEDVVAANPGMRAMALDIDNAEHIKEFVARLSTEVPNVNVLINNAGIQRREDLLSQPEDLADVEAMVTTNLLGPIRLTAALLPILRAQQDPAIINVTSGLGFVPLASVPTYSATKAAMHSYTLSLRHALEGLAEVIEIVPPYVQTNLVPGFSADPRAMPLADFISEVMDILQNEPDIAEVVVERCRPLRLAVHSDDFQTLWETRNAAMAASAREISNLGS